MMTGIGTPTNHNKSPRISDLFPLMLRYFSNALEREAVPPFPATRFGKCAGIYTGI